MNTQTFIVVKFPRTSREVVNGYVGGKTVWSSYRCAEYATRKAAQAVADSLKAANPALRVAVAAA